MADSAHLRRYHFGCFLRVLSDCGLVVGIMAHVDGGDFGDESGGGNGGSLSCAYRILRIRYVSLDYFKIACFEHCRRLERGFESSLHLGFSHLTSRDFDAIEEARNDLPRFTVLYDSQEEILILKFRLGVAHEFCSRLVASAFTDVFTAGTGDRAAFDSVGASRFTVSWGQRVRRRPMRPLFQSHGSWNLIGRVLFLRWVSGLVRPLWMKHWLNCAWMQGFGWSVLVGKPEWLSLFLSTALQGAL
jgi:hypothetical protein